MRLVPRKEGTGRLPAVEVMINTATIKEYILDPQKTTGIYKAIQEGVNQYGMQTFDQALMQLFKKDGISYEDAASDKTWEHFEGEMIR